VASAPRVGAWLRELGGDRVVVDLGGVSHLGSAARRRGGGAPPGGVVRRALDAAGVTGGLLAVREPPPPVSPRLSP
jgi:hypothetical protein